MILNERAQTENKPIGGSPPFLDFTKLEYVFASYLREQSCKNGIEYIKHSR